jgi:hypothetical protein
MVYSALPVWVKPWYLYNYVQDLQLGSTPGGPGGGVTGEVVG